MNPSDPQPESRWEIELDRRLKALPTRRAPATLAPRVMAALAARERLPWYRRTWWQWPPPAKMLSLSVAFVALGLLTWLAVYGSTDGLATSLLARLRAGTESLTPIWSLFTSLAEALTIVLRQTTAIAWFLVVGFLLSAYLSCIGVGTALYRIALPRRQS